jgi:quercetin dioxygenase-like cupin family protein
MSLMLVPLIMITLTPAEQVQLSTHDGQEFLFVLEGQMMAQATGQKAYVDPIYYDPSEPHFAECVGVKEAKLLAVIYPGRQ